MLVQVTFPYIMEWLRPKARKPDRELLQATETFEIPESAGRAAVAFRITNSFSDRVEEVLEMDGRFYWPARDRTLLDLNRVNPDSEYRNIDIDEWAQAVADQTAVHFDPQHGGGYEDVLELVKLKNTGSFGLMKRPPTRFEDISARQVIESTYDASRAHVMRHAAELLVHNGELYRAGLEPVFVFGAGRSMMTVDVVEPARYRPRRPHFGTEGSVGDTFGRHEIFRFDRRADLDARVKTETCGDTGHPKDPVDTWRKLEIITSTPPKFDPATLMLRSAADELGRYLKAEFERTTNTVALYGDLPVPEDGVGPHLRAMGRLAVEYGVPDHLAPLHDVVASMEAFAAYGPMLKEAAFQTKKYEVDAAIDMAERAVARYRHDVAEGLIAGAELDETETIAIAGLAP